MKKKALALLLATAMTMAAAGCGNDSGTSSTPGSSEGSAQDGAQESTQDSTEDSSTGEDASEDSSQESEEPAYDFGGRTVRIGSYYDMTPKPENSIFEKAFADRIAYVEENYNCNIEFVVVGDDYVGSYVTSVLSGDPVCDVGYILSYKLLRH